MNFDVNNNGFSWPFTGGDPYEGLPVQPYGVESSDSDSEDSGSAKPAFAFPSNFAHLSKLEKLKVTMDGLGGLEGEDSDPDGGMRLLMELAGAGGLTKTTREALKEAASTEEEERKIRNDPSLTEEQKKFYINRLRMQTRAKAKKDQARMNNAILHVRPMKTVDEVDRYEAHFQEKTNRINAYLIFQEQCEKNHSVPNDAQFNEFYTQYKVERANQSFDEVGEETKTAPKTVATSAARQKKKKGRNKKANIPAIAKLTLNPSDEAAPTAPAVAVLPLEQRRLAFCQSLFAGPAALEHPHVARWHKSIKGIRKFPDRPIDPNLKPYSEMDDDELRVMKMIHFAPGTGHLIRNTAYAFPTPRGCGMICHLKTHAQPATVRSGTLYFGVNWGRDEVPDRIFHRCVVRQDIVKMPIQTILKGPDIQKPEDEGKWEVAGQFQPTIDENGTIQLRYAADKFSLFIYPVRREKLPPGLF